VTSKNESTELYDHPGYYELAFSFRDVRGEVTCFEHMIDKYAAVPVVRVLELACGPSPHLEELCRRGYEYHDLDANGSMLRAGRAKARDDWRADFHQASMIDFDLGATFQFAFVALGSLYARNTTELKTHFRSVANALDPGGLYMMDWCVQFGHAPVFSESGQSWKMERGDVAISVNVTTKHVDPVEQVVKEVVRLDVVDRGKSFTISSTDLRRIIFPHEFLLFVDTIPEFEFVGWWNSWDLDQPLAQVTGEINRPIALLRRLL
jgi:SAM-dependent methyltransferase